MPLTIYELQQLILDIGPKIIFVPSLKLNTTMSHDTRIFHQNSKNETSTTIIYCATSRNPLFSCGIFVFWPIKEKSLTPSSIKQRSVATTWRRPRSPSKYINEQRPFRATHTVITVLLLLHSLFLQSSATFLSHS
jgi:hypothetical protein